MCSCLRLEVEDRGPRGRQCPRGRAIVSQGLDGHANEEGSEPELSLPDSVPVTQSYSTQA
jgi:hypothetical protein